MAQATLTNVVRSPAGVAVAGASIEVRLKPDGVGFRSSDNSELAQLVTSVTDGTGAWSFLLEKNADVVPANSYYEVTELLPASVGPSRVWSVLLTTGGPLVGQLSSAPGASPPVVAVIVDPASAGYGTPVAFGPIAAQGVSVLYSRADHVHPGANDLQGLLAARPAASTVADGTIYLATDVNGGTPYFSARVANTWTQMAPGVAAPGGGIELGYAANVNGTTLGATTVPVDLVGGCQATITVSAGQGPLYVTFGGFMYHSIAGQEPILLLLEDGVEIGRAYAHSDTANAGREVEKTRRWTAAAGVHTYKLQLGQTNAVASAAVAGTIANDPIFLSIRQG